MHVKARFFVNTLRGTFIISAIALILSPLPAEFAFAAHAKSMTQYNPEPAQHQLLRVAGFQVMENQKVTKDRASTDASGEASNRKEKQVSSKQAAKESAQNSLSTNGVNKIVKPRTPKQVKPKVAAETEATHIPNVENNRPLDEQSRSSQGLEKKRAKNDSNDAIPATSAPNQVASAGSEQSSLGSNNTEHQPLVSKPLFKTPPTPPSYPSMARRRGVEGTVVIEVSLDALGLQTELRIQKSSGNPLLDSSAVNAVRNWRFLPHQLEGLAIASRVQIPVRFKLN